MDATEAATILDVNSTCLKHFNVIDFFNNNTIEGYLCHQSDHRYGALVIFNVNGIETAPQLIYATPKLHYPFDRDENAVGGRRFKFPKFVKVNCYTKLDGTAICAYSYADAAGQRYVTFKTRLTAILQESEFGPFRSMWLELLDKYPYLKEPVCVKSGEYSLSFEMYGSRNPHLIRYIQTLETRLLFGVKQKTAAVQIPEHFKLDIGMTAEASCLSGTDLVAFYNDMREKAHQMNITTEDDMIIGTEGYVMYVLTEEGAWLLYKAKPEDVEAIHWSNGVLPMDVILPTCWNALESEPKLTVEIVEQLLTEEFTPQQVMAARPRVEKAVVLVNEKIAWREKVRTAYLNTGLAGTEYDKRTLMRAISPNFKKSEMKAVFTALLDMGFVTR